MITQGDESFSERLQSLEADVRRLSRQRYMAIAFGLFAIFYVLSRDLSRPGNPTFGIIRAKAVVAEQFRVRRHDPPDSEMVLELDDDSNPQLRFYDSNGNGRITLGIQKDEGPNLVFYDKEKNARFSIMVESFGGRCKARCDSLLRDPRVV